MAVGLRAGIPGRGLAHLAGRLAGMEATDQDTLADQVRALGRCALVVITERAGLPTDHAAVGNVEERTAEALAEHHDVAQAFVLVDVVALGEMPEGLMREDPGEGRVADHRELATGCRRGIEQGDGA